MAAELLIDADIVTAGSVLHEGWVLVEDGLIAEIGGPGRQAPGADRRLSLKGTALVPGFIDVHVHGGGGATFAGGPDEAVRAARFHAWHGTTTMLASLATCSPADLLQRVSGLSGVCGQVDGGGQLLGIHLEGPFISKVRKGAHDPSLIRAPDETELGRVLKEAKGRVRTMTAAPELPGFLGLARTARHHGVIISAGHSDAEGPAYIEAIANGARSLTHTFNAMRPASHRSPGPVDAILDSRVLCELIADGVHVAPAFVRMLRKLAGRDRLVLVTDAATWAGAGEGEPSPQDGRVDVRDGAVFLKGTDTLAGSTLTMAEAARRYAGFTGAGLVELAAVTSANAARLLGEDGRVGDIRPGYWADLVVLGKQLECAGVMSRGVWVRAVGQDARVREDPGR